MKKLTLALVLMAAISFTACQQAKDAADDAANAAGDAVENAADNVAAKVEEGASAVLDAVTAEDKAIEEQDPFGGDMSADEVSDILKK